MINEIFSSSLPKHRRVSSRVFQRASIAVLAAIAGHMPIAHAADVPGITTVTTATAIEFRYTPLDYYFVTSRETEKSILDSTSGWVRTGQTFKSLSSPLAGSSGVSRYFFDKVAKNAMRGSHFYTVTDSDRALLAALNPSNAQTVRLPYFEGNDSFAYLPDAFTAAGTCVSGTQAVYRVFRGNTNFPDDPNHRFTTDKSIYDQFVGLGWTGEGVSFCAPTAVTDNSACPQKSYFPDVSLRTMYVDKNLDGKTSWDTTASLQPSSSVSCANGVVSVTSNGVPNFDAVGNGRGGADASYQTNAKTWKFPQNPTAATATTSFRNQLGPIALMVNGVQIYGPFEAAIDNYADPFKNGLLNFCGGHVETYHFHSFPECFFNQKTLGGTNTFLPAKTPGVVIGYAFDGFPILAPYEYCSSSTDTTCVNGIREIVSAYKYNGTGSYSTEDAFGTNSYQAGYDGSTLDACNGKSDSGGNYAYYATRRFPYYLGCYRGTATANR